MRYQVFWRNTVLGEENEHGIYNSLEEAKESVRQWWKQNGYEPYYIREWSPRKGVYTWDYGSHIFFYQFRAVGDENE